MFYRAGNIGLSKKTVLNTIRHDNVDYPLSRLNKKFPTSKGGNSNVFLLTDPDTGLTKAIKFCKYDLNNPDKRSKKRIARFSREVEALQQAKDNECPNVIDVLFDNYKDIGDYRFHFYVMEKASSDLTEFLKAHELSTAQKILLCVDILNGVKQLHELNIYHRDIKPDNILLVNKEWKIGDLGLVEYRDSDFKIREEGERIGPIGWLSPEAMNKYFNEGDGKKNLYGHDCALDEKSDIFQLGKLFWFIFQGNIPIGQIRRRDFKIGDKDLYDILLMMLRHSKEKRLSIQEIEEGFKTRYPHYGI